MKRKLDWFLIKEFNNQIGLNRFISSSYDEAFDQSNKDNCLVTDFV